MPSHGNCPLEKATFPSRGDDVVDNSPGSFPVVVIIVPCSFLEEEIAVLFPEELRLR